MSDQDQDEPEQFQHSVEEEELEDDQEVVNMKCRRRTGKSRELNSCGSMEAIRKKLTQDQYRYECAECGATWTLEGPSSIDL